MKKIILILLFYSTSFFGQYSVIPDPVFEQNLINQQIDVNTTIDGQVLTSAIASITQLNLISLNGGNDSITNLQGIEGFIALNKLSVFANESLQFVNVTNLNLKELYFNNNFIINATINAPLLEILVFYNFLPAMQSLDITNCPMLKNLYCPDNQLTILDIANNSELEILSIGSNKLTQLITGNNQKLIRVVCWNNLLTSLDFVNSPLLTHLFTGTNNLTSLNVSQNTLLQVLGCESNNLTSINVSQNISLNSLSCHNNNISSLNLQNNPQLQFLLCNTNNLTILNVHNGNNTLLNGTYTANQTSYPRFDASNNPNLHCILVDDVANCQANWLAIDSTSNFVSSQTECDNLLNNQSFKIDEIVVYPNPVSDILKINNNKYEILDISIYDLLGKKIITQKTNTNQIDVSNLTSGVYMILIIANNEIFNSKIIKN